MGEGLLVQADPPLPPALAVGNGTALLVRGRCSAPLRSGALRAGDWPAQPLDAGPGGAFWGVVGVRGRGAVTVRVSAHLRDGRSIEQELGEVVLEPGLAAAPATATVPGSVAICMATHEPPPDLFAAQIASLRAQSHTDWRCVIADDCSSSTGLRVIEAAIDDDERFSLHRLDARLGPYGAFERALALAPAQSEYVALCDQDDRWDDDKLAALVAELRARPDAALAFCDQRIVDADGRLLSPTYWTDRDGRPGPLARLLVANTVSGSAALFRRELLDLALPFPPQVGPDAFHDHWIALVARTRGPIAFVERALQDYVQHERNVIGHASRAVARSAAPWQERWERSYFEVLLARRFLAHALLARCGEDPALRRLARGDHGAAGLALVFARAVAGRTRRARTLGHEERMLRGALWRRWARARRT